MKGLCTGADFTNRVYLGLKGLKDSTFLEFLNLNSILIVTYDLALVLKLFEAQYKTRFIISLASSTHVAQWYLGGTHR